MGGEPGRTLALAQPGADPSPLGLGQLHQLVEAVGIKQQQPTEALQLIPQLALAWVCRSRGGTQARSKNHRIKSFQGPGLLQGVLVEEHHMGLAGPKPRGPSFGHQGLEAAAAAGASPLEAELGGAEIAGATGHHQQATAAIFAGGRIQRRPRRRGPIRRPQGQGLARGQGGQLGGRQAQVDALQLAHPGQGAVLDQALLEQAQAVGGAGPGGGAAEQPAAIAAEARGHIDGHEGPWSLLVAPCQQAGQGRFERAPLADAEKPIDPEGAIARIGFFLQQRNP